MRAGKTLIDFGCGFAEPLVLWAENFGILGVGIDIRQKAIERARVKIAQSGLKERLQVVQGKGAEYRFEPGSFDFATCVGRRSSGTGISRRCKRSSKRSAQAASCWSERFTGFETACRLTWPNRKLKSTARSGY